MTLVAIGGLAMIGAWTGTRTGMGFSTNRNSKPREVTYHHCYNGSRGLIVSEPQPARVLSIHPVGFGLVPSIRIRSKDTHTNNTLKIGEVGNQGIHKGLLI